MVYQMEGPKMATIQGFNTTTEGSKTGFQQTGGKTVATREVDQAHQGDQAQEDQDQEDQAQDNELEFQFFFMKQLAIQNSNKKTE